MTQHLQHWIAEVSARADRLLANQALLLGIGTQLGFIAAALLLFVLLRPLLRRLLDQQVARLRPGPATQLLSALARIVPWALLLLSFWFGRLAFHAAGLPARLLHLAENLALAWVVIRFTSSLVRNPKVASAVAIGAWLFAALNIVGLIDPTLSLLDSMSLTIGHFRLTVLLVLKGLIFLVVLLWLANMSAHVLEQRLQALPTMAPAMQVLAAKLSRVVLITLAVVIALNSVGIDLTAFAVFSGAIGVGVGFGLQKVVSNLVSGVILLLDRSIKPGDVIEIDGTYGWITRLNARFVSVSTRDGIEHLIPNEDLITHRVTNWSYTHDMVRLHAPVGIAYSSDLRLAMELCVDAAKDTPRILETPPPVCLVKNFGDSAIDLELRFWIRDPKSGTANVKSAVLLGIWDRFQEHKIQIPFPQRELRIPEVGELVEAIASALGRSPESADRHKGAAANGGKRES
jgi:small-conductance mechanosensitive channel